MDEVNVAPWLSLADRRVLLALDERLGPAESSKSTAVADGWAIRLALAGLAPAWLSAIAFVSLIKLVTRRGDSPPILVLHERVGHGRRRLWVPKLATMHVPGNRRILRGLIEVATGPPVDGIVSDSIDVWLRQTGLDELPQLALIVRGQMRLIGPRPVTPDELDEMALAGTPVIDTMAPGMLGVWQLLDRDAYDLSERQWLDEWMLERWSPELRRGVARTGFEQAVSRMLRRTR